MIETVTIGGHDFAVEQAVESPSRLEFMDVSKGLRGVKFFVRGSQQVVPDNWYVLRYPHTSGNLFGIISPDFLGRLVDEQ